MASFMVAYEATVAHEGTYSNNPTDRGGETWKGVARKRNPSWVGWSIIDNLKAGVTLSKAVEAMKQSVQLEEAVRSIYKTLYWDIHMLDAMKDQEMANEVFDTGVNCGTGLAATFLQRCMNVCNTDGKGNSLWQELNVDGRIGHTTLSIFNSVGDIRKGLILKAFNCLQGARYISIAEANSSQEIFMLGWFNRVTI